MFATLDTSSRRLKFPEEKELIITDTVGFIRDLPEDLVAAFKATLEELEDASLLIHLVDISNPQFENHIEAVNKILKELELETKPVILVFNKIDKLSSFDTKQICSRYNAIGISALDKQTLIPLIEEIKKISSGRKLPVPLHFEFINLYIRVIWINACFQLGNS